MKPENILLDDQGKSLSCVLLIVDILASCWYISDCASDYLHVDKVLPSMQVIISKPVIVQSYY